MRCNFRCLVYAFCWLLTYISLNKTWLFNLLEWVLLNFSPSLCKSIFLFKIKKKKDVQLRDAPSPPGIHSTHTYTQSILKPRVNLSIWTIQIIDEKFHFSSYLSLPFFWTLEFHCPHLPIYTDLVWHDEVEESHVLIIMYTMGCAWSVVAVVLFP